MARAEYIWTVVDVSLVTPGIAGTFTVKHEMIYWLHRQSDTTRKRFGVFRTRDNRPEVEPVYFSVAELIG
jgi:hypothetical protein